MLRTRSIFGVVVVLAGAASMAWAAESGSDQPSATKIWNGVYSTAQAERGHGAFLKFCADCHAPNLAGGAGRGPALRGASFMQDWQNGSVDALFVKIRDGMPANYPESVTADVKIDILGFLLQQNGFPAGATELKTVETELADILIVQKGEQKAPNFALVRMTGCLTQGPGNTWTLDKSSEPVVTKDETSTEAALKAAADGALGTQTFELKSVAAFKPDSHNGQRMEARGLLYREGEHNWLESDFAGEHRIGLQLSRITEIIIS